MLFHISKSLLNELKEEKNWTESVIQALQNLAQARSQGDHIVTADPGVIEQLRKNTRLSETTKSIYSKIDAELAKYGALRDKLATYVQISSIKELDSTELHGNFHPIQIPLIRFQRNDIIQPTFLIAENLLDCQFFMLISSWFSKRYSEGKLPTKLQAVYCPGGGDTTAKLLDHHSKSQKYMALCITDSDKKHPGGEFGETAKKCNRISRSDLIYHISLPVRSAENLLCKEQILEVLNAEKTRLALLSNLDRLSPLFGQAAWKYFHIKNGFPNITGPHKPNTEGAYWNQIAAQFNVKENSSDAYLLPPISSKLLSWAVEHLENNEPTDLIQDQQLFDIWQNLALLVSSWTCATDPIRA